MCDRLRQARGVRSKVGRTNRLNVRGLRLVLGVQHAAVQSATHQMRIIMATIEIDEFTEAYIACAL